MASHPDLVNEIFVSTSSPDERVKLTWIIPNFKALVQNTIRVAYSEVELTRLPFVLSERLFPPGSPDVSMMWKLQVDYDDEDLIHCVELVLCPCPSNRSRPTVNATALVEFFPARTRVSPSSTESERDGPSGGIVLIDHPELIKFSPYLYSVGWEIFSWLKAGETESWSWTKLEDYLDEEGSLNLELTVDFYSQYAQNLPHQDGKYKPCKVEGFRVSKDVFCNQASSSEVIASIIDTKTN